MCIVPFPTWFGCRANRTWTRTLLLIQNIAHNALHSSNSVTQHWYCKCCWSCYLFYLFFPSPCSRYDFISKVFFKRLCQKPLLSFYLDFRWSQLVICCSSAVAQAFRPDERRSHCLSHLLILQKHFEWWEDFMGSAQLLSRCHIPRWHVVTGPSGCPCCQIQTDPLHSEGQGQSWDHPKLSELGQKSGRPSEGLEQLTTR